MLRTLVRERLTAQDGAQQPATLFDVGRPTREEQEGNKPVNNRFTEYSSTGADYLTARIARDHPDILDRMKVGEYKSVRARRWPNAAPPMRRTLYFSQ
jgi:hypothetical protein